MQARQVQHHLQVGQHHAVAALHREVHLAVHRTYVDGAHLGFLVEAVAGDRAGDLLANFAHGGVIGAQDGGAIEGHAVQEVDERLLEAAEVMPVGFHVVGVDVGHDRHHRQQIQEGRIGLVGFDHDVVSATQARIGPRAVEAPTNHKGRVQAGFGQHTGHQAGSGGLAVGARNCNALLETHQLGQHQGARHDGDVHFASAHDFGVVGLHRSGGHHRIGTCDVGLSVAHIGGDTQGRQAFEGGAVGKV